MTTKVRPQQIVDGDKVVYSVHIKNAIVDTFCIDWEMDFAGTVDSCKAFANNAASTTYALKLSAGGGPTVGTLTAITGISAVVANNSSTGDTLRTATALNVFAIGARLYVDIASLTGDELIIKITCTRTS